MVKVHNPIPADMKRPPAPPAPPQTTSDACLKGAWAALLKGDTDERDRLCERAKVLLEAETTANAIEKVMSIDFYVKPNGVSISSKAMAKAAGVIQ